jgi:anti-anti-sigma regulatory factor
MHITLEGTFDASAAAALCQTLAAAGTEPVAIDFSRVRHFVDFAVAVLTSGLQGRQVELRGLSRHQEAVFRYFGVPVVGRGSSQYGRAEEVLAL